MIDKKYFLKPGYIFFSSEGHLLETVLGSCISVCLWDKKNKMGIMTHYIYAFYRENEKKGVTGKIALPFALNFMIEKGSIIKDISASVIGGGKNPKLNDKVGNENIKYAMDFLNENHINIDLLDVGEEKSRKVIFDTYTGKVLVSILNETVKKIGK